MRIQHFFLRSGSAEKKSGTGSAEKKSGFGSVETNPDPTLIRNEEKKYLHFGCTDTMKKRNGSGWPIINGSDRIQILIPGSL